jgi:hypothetical protein
MRPLAVLTQAFAMVANGDDDGAIDEIALIKKRQDAPDLRIDKANLTNVRLVGMHRGVRFGRLVRRVRVVEVEPREKPRGRCVIQKPEG